LRAWPRAFRGGWLSGGTHTTDRIINVACRKAFLIIPRAPPKLTASFVDVRPHVLHGTSPSVSRPGIIIVNETGRQPGCRQAITRIAGLARRVGAAALAGVRAFPRPVCIAFADPAGVCAQQNADVTAPCAKQRWPWVQIKRPPKLAAFMPC
jgi:hypothetical protein